MNLRTELDLQPAPWSLGVGDQLVTLGSCFALTIGQRFKANKFKAMINPFGTTYHPLAIHRIINYAAYQEYPAPHTYLHRDGISYNYDFHSSQCAANQRDLEQNLHDQISTVHFFLKDCAVLLITYGTAWLYERVDTGEPVANCHRTPAGDFTRRLTPVDEIVSSFRDTYRSVIKLNPGIRIILTLSPVRHTRDTLPLNSVSKAAIRVACHHLAEEFPMVSYFPAYELLVDDLRDYRFYKVDLIHPTPMAEDYIWEKFSTVFFSGELKAFIRDWGLILQALEHKAFQSESPAHLQFLARTLLQLEKLKPLINVDDEVALLKSQIIKQTAPAS